MQRSASNSPRGAPPARATIAVIGAGIVGNCLVGHLADLGWEDLVLIDQGPLPNPGGSTVTRRTSSSPPTTTARSRC